MIEYVLKLGSGFCRLLLHEECLTSQIGNLKKSITLVRSSGLEQLNRLRRIAFLKFDPSLYERQGDFVEYGVVRKTPAQFSNDSLCLAELAASRQCVGCVDHRKLTL